MSSKRHLNCGNPSLFSGATAVQARPKSPTSHCKFRCVCRQTKMAPNPSNCQLRINHSAKLKVIVRQFIFIEINYMANPVLGKSLCSDWFFLGQDFAVRTVSMETVQTMYFCFGAKPANSTFTTKTAEKKCENCHSSH